MSATGPFVHHQKHVGHLIRTDQYLSRCWNADQAPPRWSLGEGCIDLGWRGTQSCRPRRLCLALCLSVCLSAAAEPQTVVLPRDLLRFSPPHDSAVGEGRGAVCCEAPVLRTAQHPHLRPRPDPEKVEGLAALCPGSSPRAGGILAAATLPHLRGVGYSPCSWEV